MMNFLIAGMAGVVIVGETRVKPTAKFFEAVAQVESGGNDWLVGDKHLRQKAYGRYQIRQPVCDDYNRVHHTAYQAKSLVGKRKLSIKICRWYLNYHCRCLKGILGRIMSPEEVFARTWNGGPNGVRKPATLKYWHKVERTLQEGKQCKKLKRLSSSPSSSR